MASNVKNGKMAEGLFRDHLKNMKAAFQEGQPEFKFIKGKWQHAKSQSPHVDLMVKFPDSTLVTDVKSSMDKHFNFAYKPGNKFTKTAEKEYKQFIHLQNFARVGAVSGFMIYEWSSIHINQKQWYFAQIKDGMTKMPERNTWLPIQDLFKLPDIVLELKGE